jgi:hypothetical protein
VDSTAMVLGLSSMYNRVILRSRGITRIVPSVSELMTVLLHISEKSVSITPGELMSLCLENLNAIFTI